MDLLIQCSEDLKAMEARGESCDKALEEIQMSVEAWTKDFTDPDSFYAKCPIILDKLIKKGAKRFILKKNSRKLKSK